MAGTSPFRIVLRLLVLPLLLLSLVTLRYRHGGAPEWRRHAVLLAAVPLVTLVSLGMMAEAQFRRAMKVEGETTCLRDGPYRTLAEAIARNDIAPVGLLVAMRDLNQAGLSGMAPLMLAMRRRRRTPGRQEVLQAMLQAGANPNLGAQFELPLAIAIHMAARAGKGPLPLDACSAPCHACERGRRCPLVQAPVSAWPPWHHRSSPELTMSVFVGPGHDPIGPAR